MSIIIRAEPSIQVQPGGIITYTITAKNTGGRAASMTRAWIDYDPSMLTIVETTFARSSDWVSKADPGYIRFDFGLIGNDKSYSATMQGQVAADVPIGTVIPMWAGYEWVDEGRLAQKNMSNAAPVLVGNTPLTSPWVWMAGEPFEGEQGTTFSFHSDRFVPGERIKVWLQFWVNVERKQSLDSKADGQGRFWIHLPAAEMLPGRYQLIVQGERSGLMAGKVFVVKP
jgi:uncharacterized repeat protein (TIGR01451 family)